MSFEDTYTDSDFERSFRNANRNWLEQAARNEPDLEIDGMRGSLLSRFLALFGAKPGR